MKYVIGTRGSKLALAQAEAVRDTLKKAYPGNDYEIQVIHTKGDLIQDKPLDQLGSKGVFIKEIEEELLKGTVDIGVHSMKDMPASPAEGLAFAKAWKREDPRDVLVLREAGSFAELPAGAVIGTGSKRRGLQLLKARDDLRIVDIRGNVDTRLRKLSEQKLDAVALAAAGLNRLGLAERISCYLDPDVVIPAPAQGILALEIRREDKNLKEELDALHDPETEWEATAERGFLAGIGGDCHLPVGAFCSPEEDGTHRLRCVFGNARGTKAAYASVTGDDPRLLAEKAVREIREKLAGKVTLVGAGPGDPGLITVKGLAALKEADCVIYDRLAAPGLLEATREDCEKIYVGKENHHHTLRQEEINELLVRKAMEADRVVRLKGGDVYVFGRGGEEGLYLYERGISFDVIPGISSSMAGLAYAGIPITHRGIATGFHVVTAHNRKDELADIDFMAMARGTDTLVFLMGLGKLPEIAERLIEAGMPSDTPAAVIEKATTSAQRTVTAALSEITDKTREEGIGSPALIVVGKVIGLRERLNFFENKPLFGKKLLVPKIGEQTSGLTEALTEKGAEVDELQVGRIEYADRTFDKERLEKVSWIVLTSKNGVEAFFRDLFASGLDVRSLAGARFAVIGARTADYLYQHGVKADLVPEKFTGKALAEALKNVLKQEDLVWYIKAGNADSSLKEAVGGLCHFEEIVAYENMDALGEDSRIEAPERYDGVFLTCASSADRLMEALGQAIPETWRKPGKIFSIGPKCGERLRQYGFHEIEEANESTYAGLLDVALQTIK